MNNRPKRTFHPLVQDLLESRYLRKNKKGELMEDWEDLCERVSRTVADVEQTKDKRQEVYNYTYDLIHDGVFLPNSPTLMGAGLKGHTLSACFALPIEDDTENIFDTLTAAALITKAGGGVGINFSKIRPMGSSVSLRGGISSGPVSYLQPFDAMIQTMKQGGVRKGAMMASMHAAHLDIFGFIACKSAEGELTNMNISVLCPDALMQKALAGEDWELRFNEVSRLVSAMSVLDAIAERAWQSGEPGILFIDRIQADNPVKKHVKIKTSNPCWTGDTRVWTIDGPKTFKELADKGEDVLVLTNVNNRLEYRMMRNPRKTGNTDTIYYIFFNDGSFVKCTEYHQLILKNGEKKFAFDLKKRNELKGVYDGKMIIGMNIEHIEIRQNFVDVYNGTVDETHTYFVYTSNNKGILSANCGELPLRPYEACNLGSINLNHIVDSDGKIDYKKLADITWKGVRILDNIIDANWFPLAKIDKAVKNYRAIGLGIMGLADMFIKMGVIYGSEQSIEIFGSIMAVMKGAAMQASIELGKEKGNFPAFRKSEYQGNVEAMRNSTLTCIAPTGTIAMIAGCSHGIEPYYSFEPQSREITGMGIVTLPEPWAELKGTAQEKYRVVASDLTWKQHIDMQAAGQKHLIGGAISKTINLPHSATVEDIKQAYIYAWQSGCKGLTVYRDGCDRAGLLKDLCPDCQGEMIWHGGCHLCKVCGFSDKCSAG